MTDLNLKALIAIRDNPGITITEFSKFLWPDSDLWNVARKDGKGKGYKVIRNGQNYLGKLLKTGWIREVYTTNCIYRINRKFYLTDNGFAELNIALKSMQQINM